MRGIRGALITAAVGAVGLAACGGTTTGGGSGGSSSVSGTASGQNVPTTDTVGIVGSSSQGSVMVAYAGAAITNVANTCSELQKMGNPASATALSLVVTAEGASVPTGQYMVTGASSTGTTQVNVQYAAQDANCMPTAQESAVSGSVTLTTVSSTTVGGSFDVTMSNGDHLTGSFTAPVCNVSLQGTSQNPPACGT